MGARRELMRRCRQIGREIHRRSSAGIVPRSMIFWMVSSEIRTARPNLDVRDLRRQTQPRRHFTDSPRRSAASGRLLSLAVFVVRHFSS